MLPVRALPFQLLMIGIVFIVDLQINWAVMQYAIGKAIPVVGFFTVCAANTSSDFTTVLPGQTPHDAAIPHHPHPDARRVFYH